MRVHHLFRTIAIVTLAFILVCVSAHLRDQRARACSPQPSQVTDIWPENGGVIPANAAVILQGQTLGTYSLVDPSLEATINGQPVTVRRDAELSRREPHNDADTILALRFDPAPVPGDEIALSGSACMYYRCDPLDYRVTVGEPDLAPPPDPVDLWWDFVFYGAGLPFMPDSCGDYPDSGSFDITASLPTPEPSPSPADDWYLVDLWVDGPRAPDDDRRRGRWRWKWRLDEPVVEYGMRFQNIDLPTYIDPEGHCVHLTIRDAAGNASATLDTCAPCRTARSAPRDGPEFEFYRGGYCPAELADDAAAAGCSAGPTHGASWWLALALLGLLSLTTRRRAGRPSGASGHRGSSAVR